ncbi:glycosyltransferase family 39 protein [Patescibacteria group bacterium]|nr:glycosyltransferase family 39 protein [Patescibacteria group bacterium]
MKKNSLLILGLILVLAFTVRLYRFNSPIADWHSWRQADTSSVSRIFAEEGFNLLYPRFMDLSNVPSGKDNPLGYRFVEFPIYNFFQAGLFKYIGIFTLEEWGRLVSIFASLASITFVYLILKNRGYWFSGIIAAFLYATLPFSVYYGRTILPDQTMVAAILGGTYFFQVWIGKKKLSILNYQFWTSLILTACAFLLKPYALFFTLPIIYLCFEKFGLETFKKWKLWLFLIISVVPLALWRNWMQQFSEGIPVSDWLFNGGGIRFRPAFFRWMFFERLTKLILGYFGVIFLALPFIMRIKKNDLLFSLSFVASSLLYVFVIARGNIQHDYYQILIIPSLVIFLGMGMGQLLTKLISKKRYLILTALLIPVILMYFFSWNQVKDYFNINNQAIITAGKATDELTPKNAKVIASYNGDTSFLYQTKRKGWASMEKPLPEMARIGAGYLILVNPKKEDYGIGKEYKIIKATKDYIIFNLNQRP